MTLTLRTNLNPMERIPVDRLDARSLGKPLSWKGNLSTLYRATVRTDVRFEYPSEPAREQFEDTLSENERVSVPIIPMQQNIANTSQGAVIEDTPAVTRANNGMQACFWKKMEQPPPKPTPFDGDPPLYLRFRANFGDQVERRASLNDNKEMNYLMSYTTVLREPSRTLKAY